MTEQSARSFPFNKDDDSQTPRLTNNLCRQEAQERWLYARGGHQE
jgi:hypothetical protein